MMINLNEGGGRNGRAGETPLFDLGDLVAHCRYGYRGVVVAVDDRFCGSDDWYLNNQTQPAKDQPWYHVLVHGKGVATYAAQSSLEEDPSGVAVEHPLVAAFFAGFADGKYVRNTVAWEG